MRRWGRIRRGVGVGGRVETGAGAGVRQSVSQSGGQVTSVVDERK